MSNSNKHLDDLFAAARHEEPILSRENAEDLLRESKHMQLPSKLISTKGAIMTSFGLSIAVVTAYFFLSSTPSANRSQPDQLNSAQPQAANLFAQSALSNTEEPKKSAAKTTKKIIIVKNDESVPTPPEPPQPPGDVPVPPVPPVPPLPGDLVVPPMNVAGITPLPLPPDKYTAMGIVKKDDGTVIFSQKNENGKILTMGFPKDTWGITIFDDNNDKQTTAPNFTPLIVTDTKGNRRLMQFTGEKNGMKMRSIEIHSRDDNNDVDPEKISELVNSAMKIEGALQIGGKDGDVDAMKLGLDSNDLKELHNALKIETEINIDSNSGTMNASDPQKKEIRITIHENKDEKDTTIDGKPRKMIIMKKIVRTDSVIHAADKAIKQAQKEIEEVVRKLHINNLDTSKLKINIKDLQNDIEENDDDDDNDSDDVPDLTDLKSQMSEFDNLIPVLVRTATSEHVNKDEGITFDDGLIFWYSPDKEILSELPRQNTPHNAVAASSNDQKSSVISSTAIYPNPAKNSTTVHFTLAEPRTLAFSIHDLLGKRVMEAGNLNVSTTGNFEKELNLSELTAGVYLLVITTDKGEQSMQRLVIEK